MSFILYHSFLCGIPDSAFYVQNMISVYCIFPSALIMSNRLFAYSSIWLPPYLFLSPPPPPTTTHTQTHTRFPGSTVLDSGCVWVWILVMSVGYPVWVIPPDIRHVQVSTNSPAGEGLSLYHPYTPPPSSPLFTKRKEGVVWEREAEKNGKVVMGGRLLGRVELLKYNKEGGGRGGGGTVFERRLFVLEVWDMKKRRGM